MYTESCITLSQLSRRNSGVRNVLTKYSTRMLWLQNDFGWNTFWLSAWRWFEGDRKYCIQCLLFTQTFDFSLQCKLYTTNFFFFNESLKELEILWTELRKNILIFLIFQIFFQLFLHFLIFFTIFFNHFSYFLKMLVHIITLICTQSNSGIFPSINKY